jgi:ADP-ribose pyrophosphatase YjhB (NUDIX family)
MRAPSSGSDAARSAPRHSGRTPSGSCGASLLPPSLSRVDTIASNGIEIAVSMNGQDWRGAWHPPPDPPPGRPHGAAAVCLARGEVVLVSGDGENWDLPGGRPEPDESLVDTLRREIREEACAAVRSCRLLGFSRGACVRGPEQGRVLLRSLWRAEVVLEAWEPQFEIAHRQLVPAGEALGQLFAQPRFPDELRPLYRRMFTEAGLPVRPDAAP